MSSIQGLGTPSTGTANYDSKVNTKEKATEEKNTAAANDVAATYEPSGESPAAVKKYVPNQALVDQLLAESKQRVADLQDLVFKELTGQGKAIGSADDIWSFLANGDFKNIDEAARAQAQKDISEGGYFSVENTSARILDFAKALTGGDPSMIDKMRDAFQKGFDEATKTWGKELPDISKKTYDAVMEGFDKWAKDAEAENNQNNTTVSQ